jgi:RNA polymerase sigma-70 factor (ECF subfamily)
MHVQPQAASDPAGETLLSRVTAGELAAVRELVSQAGPTVYGFVLLRVGGRKDVAEDLLQETFVQALRSWQSFRGEASLTTWMCGIARHLIAGHFESERRAAVTASGLQLITSEQADADNAIGRVEDSDLVARALGALPVQQRQAVVLRYLDGLPVSEVAARMHKSPVQVQSLLQRARQTLRHILGSDYARV